MDSQWSKFMSQITEDLLTGFEEEDSIPRMAVEVGRALSNKRRRLIVYGVVNDSCRHRYLFTVRRLGSKMRNTWWRKLA